MRKVALVGFADSTRDGVRDVADDVEIWSLNWAYQYDFLPRVDRLFELHPLEEFDLITIDKVEKHKAFLRGEKPYPVYMQEEYPTVPGSVKYPIDEISDYIFGTKERPLLYRGDERETYYTSTCSFMVAAAIFERFDVIYTFGFEMGSTTEYRYQKPGTEALLMFAMGKGITVRIPEISLLFKSKMYAYEGGQYVTVDRMREFLDAFKEQHAVAIEALDRDTKEYMRAAEMMRTNGTTNAQEELNDAFYHFKQSLLVAGVVSGAVHATKMFMGEERAMSRQSFEHWLTDFDRHRSQAVAKLNVAEGDYNNTVRQFRKKNATQKDLEEGFNTLRECLMNAGINAGAYQCAMKFIDELDLQDPDLTMINPFHETKLEDEVRAEIKRGE